MTSAAAAMKDRLQPDTTVKISFNDDADQQQQQQHEPSFLLAYWSIRGLAAPLRMMLSAAQVNHWVIMYNVTEQRQDEAKNDIHGTTTSLLWSKESYLTDKKWLQEEFNPFCNLPFLVDLQYDNPRVLAQSNAIFAYLGRELNLMGKDEQEESKCEELLCEIMDMRNMMVRFAYGKASDSDDGDARDAQTLLQQAKRILEKFERHLSKEYPCLLNNKITKDNETGMTHERARRGVCHLVGNTFTAPDFHLWEMLDQLEHLWYVYKLPPLWGDANGHNVVPSDEGLLPHVRDFRKNFQGLRENAAYLTCEESGLAKLPFNNPYARFGSDPATLGPYSWGQAAPWRKRGVVEIHRIKVASDISCEGRADEEAGTSSRKRKCIP